MISQRARKILMQILAMDDDISFPGKAESWNIMDGRSVPTIWWLKSHALQIFDDAPG